MEPHEQPSTQLSTDWSFLACIEQRVPLLRGRDRSARWRIQRPADSTLCDYAFAASIWHTRRTVSRWFSFNVRNSNP